MSAEGREESERERVAKTKPSQIKIKILFKAHENGCPQVSLSNLK